MTWRLQVFFKAGVLGQLEDWRDERLGKIMTMFQSLIRGCILRDSYQRLLDQRQELLELKHSNCNTDLLSSCTEWRLS